MSEFTSASEQYKKEVDRHYKRNAIAIMIDNSMFYIISLGLSQYTILPLYLSKLTSSSFLIGLIPTVFIIGFALPQLFIARFLKGKKRTKGYILTVAIAQRLSILAFLILTLIQGKLSTNLVIILFFVIYFIQNLITGAWFPMWVEFIGRAIPYKRGMVFGLSYLIGGILSLLGGSLITYLLTALPYPNAISASAAIAFVASLISLVMIMLWREVEKPEEPKLAESHHDEGHLFFKIRKDHNFQQFMIWRGVMVALEMALPYLTINALRRLDAPDSQVGIFTIILSLSQTILNVFWGWLGDRIGYLKIIIFSALLGVMGAILAANAGTLFLFYLAFFLMGAMLAGFGLAGINIIYEFAHNDVPTYTAVNQLVLSPLSGAAPMLGAALVQGFGYGPLFWTSGIIALVGIVGMSLQVRNPFKPHPLREDVDKLGHPAM
jgi:MFS family permease